MTSMNNAAANAAPATDFVEPVNVSKPSRKPLTSSSEAHEKPATSSRSPTTRKTAGHTASAKAPAAGDTSNTVAEQPRQTKASVVEVLLARGGGASLEALCEATGWQPHTCRAFLTGLRKKGREVIRASDKEGKSIYLIAPDRSNAPAPATEQAEAESN
jgi:hypothetical protein